MHSINLCWFSGREDFSVDTKSSLLQVGYGIELNLLLIKEHMIFAFYWER